MPPPPPPAAPRSASSAAAENPRGDRQCLVPFPAGAPTLSGDTLSISRFLQDPAALQRRLRDYNDLRFVSDRLLTGRLRSQGGAVLYELSEPFVTDRTAESVAAGSEYPYANLTPGTAAIAAIQKWGQKALLTDEEIARNQYAGAAVDRAMQKVVNSVISQVDSITMSAIASAVSHGVQRHRHRRRCVDRRDPDDPAGHPAGQGGHRRAEPRLQAATRWSSTTCSTRT
jgi:hypothetical protein